MKVHKQVFTPGGSVTLESAVAMQSQALARKHHVQRRTPMTTFETIERQRAILRAKMKRGC